MLIKPRVRQKTVWKRTNTIDKIFIAGVDTDANVSQKKKTDKKRHKHTTGNVEQLTTQM